MEITIKNPTDLILLEKLLDTLHEGMFEITVTHLNHKSELHNTEIDGVNMIQLDTINQQLVMSWGTPEIPEYNMPSFKGISQVPLDELISINYQLKPMRLWPEYLREQPEYR